MQRDLDHYIHRRRRRRRALAIVLLMLVLGASLALLKRCSDQIDTPFDSRVYRPVDRIPPNWRPE